MKRGLFGVRYELFVVWRYIGCVLMKMGSLCVWVVV